MQPRYYQVKTEIRHTIRPLLIKILKVLTHAEYTSAVLLGDEPVAEQSFQNLLSEEIPRHHSSNY